MLIINLLSRIGLFFLVLSNTALADCGAPLPGSPGGVFTSNTISFGSVNREYCTYEPDDYAAVSSVPVIFYLHGGHQSAINMYADPKGRKDPLFYADQEDFVAVFPEGLDKWGSPSGTNLLWGDPINVSYLDTLISVVQLQFPKIDTSRVYLVGFSGGAKLIYRFVEDAGVVNPIRGIATVAGTIGGKQINPSDSPWIVHDPTVSGGAPVSALLLQGALDTHLPINGGIDPHSNSKIVMSFQSKVDIWRLLTNAYTSVPLPAMFAALPPDVHVDIYDDSTASFYVVKVVDDNLGHIWPVWDLDRLIVEFFKQV